MHRAPHVKCGGRCRTSSVRVAAIDGNLSLARHNMAARPESAMVAPGTYTIAPAENDGLLIDMMDGGNWRNKLE